MREEKREEEEERGEREGKKKKPESELSLEKEGKRGENSKKISRPSVSLLMEGENRKTEGGSRPVLLPLASHQKGRERSSKVKLFFFFLFSKLSLTFSSHLLSTLSLPFFCRSNHATR